MEEQEVKSYKIGSDTYVQKELVLGQLEQLTPVLERIAPEGKLSKTTNIADVVDLLAVVLVREGESVEDKDLNALKNIIKNNLTMQQATEIMTDFFTLNKGLPTPETKTELEAENSPASTGNNSSSKSQKETPQN